MKKSLEKWRNKGMQYSFHIEFADGSNPYYHFPCEYGKHYRELRKWKRKYRLERLNATEYTPGTKTVWYAAYPKEG